MEKSSSGGCLNNSSIQSNTKSNDKKVDDIKVDDIKVDDIKVDDIKEISTSSDNDDTPFCDFCGIFNFSTSKSSENYNYTTFDCMDEANKNAMNVLVNEGTDAAIKHMTTGKDGQPRSYSEIRQIYG